MTTKLSNSPCNHGLAAAAFAAADLVTKVRLARRRFEADLRYRDADPETDGLYGFHAGRMKLRSSAFRFPAPDRPSAMRSSPWSNSTTRCTPSWPKAESPQRYGRPIRIARAPSASA